MCKSRYTVLAGRLRCFWPRVPRWIARTARNICIARKRLEPITNHLRECLVHIRFRGPFSSLARCQVGGAVRTRSIGRGTEWDLRYREKTRTIELRVGLLRICTAWLLVRENRRTPVMLSRTVESSTIPAARDRRPTRPRFNRRVARFAPMSVCPQVREVHVDIRRTNRFKAGSA